MLTTLFHIISTKFFWVGRGSYPPRIQETSLMIFSWGRNHHPYIHSQLWRYSVCTRRVFCVRYFTDSRKFDFKKII